MDEVRTQDDERLDRNDFEGMQSLVYEAMRLGFGGITAAGGVLGGMAIDASAPAATTIAEGTILTAETVGSPPILWNSRVTHHAPLETWQSGLSTVNLAGIDPALPWIWARRSLVDHDTATRREWDSLLGDEVSITPETRRRARVVFGVGTAVPDGNPGWTKIAKIVSWAGGIPTIERIHAFDLFYTGGSGRNRSVSLLFDSFGAVGLRHVLTYLIQAVAAIKSASSADEWIAPPPVDLAAVDSRLVDIEEYHDVNGAKMLALVTADHTGAPDDWSYDLTNYVAHSAFGEGPAVIPAPILDAGPLLQTWRVPGRAFQVLLTRKAGGPNTAVPMELQVGDIVYNSTFQYSQFDVRCSKSSDATETYGSYHLIAFGTAQSGL